MAESANLGTVPVLQRLESRLRQLSSQLLSRPRPEREELRELKRALEMIAPTICQLRQAVAAQLGIIAAEQNHVG